MTMKNQTDLQPDEATQPVCPILEPEPAPAVEPSALPDDDDDVDEAPLAPTFPVYTRRSIWDI